MKKRQSVFPKAQNVVLSATQIYSVFYHRGGKKLEDLHIQEAGIRRLLLYMILYC